LAGAKTQHNPENSVGVLSLAGKVPRILVTPTQDLGAVLNSVHGVKISGTIDIPTAAQIAHLALKHRQNKHQRMRIVLFVGSPVIAEKQTLVAVGKKLKKCNVAVDVVNFGTNELDSSKLTEFVSTVNKNGNSSIVNVSPGESITDKLISSSIFSGGSISGFAADAAAATSAAQTGTVNVDQFEDDPALMMALRASLEEEQARQAGLQSRSSNDDRINPGTAKSMVSKCESEEKAEVLPASDITLRHSHLDSQHMTSIPNETNGNDASRSDEESCEPISPNEEGAAKKK
jgi:26S proteasome regulatory subunit N10